MPACVSGYASAATLSFGSAAFSFCASVENVPFAPIPAAAGASPGLVVAVDRHDGRVQHDHRLREQVLSLRLLAIAEREDSHHAQSDDDDRHERGGDLLAVLLAKLARRGNQPRDVVLLQLSTMLCLHNRLKTKGSRLMGPLASGSGLRAPGLS